MLDGEPVSCRRYGSGHINETYLLDDTTGRQYILQKINRYVFRDPESLMKNVSAVTAHLRKSAENGREALALIPARDGKDWLVDGGEYWRMYDFISGSICLDKAEAPEVFRESAAAFGRFHRQLADFSSHKLYETIPRFHDTPHRYAQLADAVKADSHGRVRLARREIEFAMSREGYASTLTDLQSADQLPLRVTHNDTKLNNVLFDRVSHQALCVIDLDTVMPGLLANDFGDSIRFGASTAAEDERDLSKVGLSLPMYEAYADGFWDACRDSITAAELTFLPDGAKMMTLECGVRFLTDYLMGDVYFHTRREGHNLDRCRTQFKLVEEMEYHWDEMRRIIKDEI